MTNKTVLITGASSGFGEASAQVFLANGWNVAATMRSPKDLAGCFVTALDVTSRSSVEAAVKSTLEKFSRIDVVVNNAGYGHWGVFEQTPDAKVRELLEVNLFGVMNVTRAVLPHFRERKAGLFVNISSGAGVFGLPASTVYNASKFALEGYSESLSYELASLGIGVKLVEPGGVLATRFGERAKAEANPPSDIRDYDAFIAGATKVFDGLRASRASATDSTSEHVARVIFEATTDATDQLRYVATSDIQPLVDARRSTSERDYMALLRARLTPT